MNGTLKKALRWIALPAMLVVLLTSSAFAVTVTAPNTTLTKDSDGNVAITLRFAFDVESDESVEDMKDAYLVWSEADNTEHGNKAVISTVAGSGVTAENTIDLTLNIGMGTGISVVGSNVLTESEDDTLYWTLEEGEEGEVCYYTSDGDLIDEDEYIPEMLSGYQAKNEDNYLLYAAYSEDGENISMPVYVNDGKAYKVEDNSITYDLTGNKFSTEVEGSEVEYTLYPLYKAASAEAIAKTITVTCAALSEEGNKNAIIDGCTATATLRVKTFGDSVVIEGGEGLGEITFSTSNAA